MFKRYYNPDAIYYILMYQGDVSWYMRCIAICCIKIDISIATQIVARFSCGSCKLQFAYQEVCGDLTLPAVWQILQLEWFVNSCS